MFYDQLVTAAAGLHPAETRRREDLLRLIYGALGAGQITDDQAQALDERIRPQRRQAVSIGQTAPLKRYSIQRTPEQRSPDRTASLARRRMHAATGPLPPQIAAGYTVSELACLRIVADECLAHGVCDIGHKAIAARAGTCETIAKRALWLAEHADHLITIERRPRSGRKHLTNLIRISRAEWRDWLAKGRRKAYAIGACNRAKPTFPIARGAQNNPPRSQDFRNSKTERVDKTGEKANRSRR